MVKWTNFGKNSKWLLFLQLQFAFWYFFCVTWLLLDPVYTSDIKTFAIHLIQYSIPLTISYGLRYVFLKYKIHRLSYLYIGIIVFFLSVLCGIFWVIGQQFLGLFFYGHFFYQEISRKLFAQIYLHFYPFVVWSVIYLGIKIYNDLALQKQQTLQALLLAKNSQLEMLKYQLNPHFLFNTLSSLRGLISTEPDKAKNMVTHISEFLRYSLHEGKNNEVALHKEIDIIKQYLDIEKIRFNDDLYTEYDISSESNDLIIPIFLIHPLVENAIKHGMQTSKLPLKIWIRTTIQDQTLFIDVKNSGKWIGDDSKSGINNTGTGLQNIQKRLVNAYPDKHSLNIIKEDDFVQVVIAIKLG